VSPLACRVALVNCPLPKMNDKRNRQLKMIFFILLYNYVAAASGGHIE